MAVSAINQHEIFSFEYTHHLLLPSLENTPKRVGLFVRGSGNMCDTLPDEKLWQVCLGDTIFFTFFLFFIFQYDVTPYMDTEEVF